MGEGKTRCLELLTLGESRGGGGDVRDLLASVVNEEEESRVCSCVKPKEKKLDFGPVVERHKSRNTSDDKMPSDIHHLSRKGQIRDAESLTCSGSFYPNYLVHYTLTLKPSIPVFPEAQLLFSY